MASQRFDIISADEVPDEEVLRAVETAFGAPRGIAWFQWKHRDGPWGPSRGVVAVDDTGIIGVRLLLPWKVISRGKERLFYRATEAATVPRARGKGVFSALNRALMEQSRAESPSPVFFSTPNTQSREGYAKLGWTWIGEIRHRWCIPVPLIPVSRTPMAGTSANSAIMTQWDPASVTWRTDPRSGNEYREASSHDPAISIAYRTLRSRRGTALLPVHATGPQRPLAKLIWSVVLREKAVAVLDTAGAGARPLTPFYGIPRGRSLLAAWHPGDPQLSRLESWNMSIGDLEAVF